MIALPLLRTVLFGAPPALNLRNVSGWQFGYDLSDLTGWVMDGSNRVICAADRSGNSGVNVLCLNGATGQKTTVPDAAALRITGSIDIDVCLALNNWNPGAYQTSLSRAASAVNRSYWLDIDNAGKLTLNTSEDGMTGTIKSGQSSSTTGLATFAKKFIRATLNVNDGAGHRVYTFYTSNDGTTWTQLGNVITIAGATSIFAGTSDLEIGSILYGSAQVVSGYVSRARVYNGIREGGGTLALDVDFSKAAKMAASFVCNTGQTVTVGTTGDTGARICGARDLVQLTAAKRPVYLPRSGVNYGYLPGVSGCWFTTPDTAATSPTLDIDIIVNAALVDWTPSGAQTLVSKWTSIGNQQSFLFAVQSNGTLILYISINGSTNVNAVSTVAPTVADGASLWVRVTRVKTTGVVTFYTSSDGASWSQLGNTVTLSANNGLFDSNASFGVGAADAGTSSLLKGAVYYASVSSTIGGAASAVFSPPSYSSGTTFTAPTGEVWTLNGGACIVTAPSLYGDGVSQYAQSAPFAEAQPLYETWVGSQLTWASGKYLIDGCATNGAGIVQTTSTPQLNLNAGSSVAANTDLALKVRGLLQALFSGAASTLGVNRNAVTTGSAGTNAANGVTIFASGTPGNYACGLMNELNGLSVVPPQGQDGYIRDGLIRKWNIPQP